MLPLMISAVLAASGATDPDMAQFQGTWVCDRVDSDGRKSQLVLVFKGSELNFDLQRDGKPGNAYSLPFTVEMQPGPKGVIEPSRLLLNRVDTKYAICFQFQGDKLILVGSLPNRPYCGLSLSGEFRQKSK